MYPVSNDYKAKISARTVTSNWYGTITLSDGTVINFDRTNLDQSKSVMTKQYAAGDTLELGNAYSNQQTLGLRGDFTKYVFYDSEIEMFFRLMLTASTYEDVPCGTYVVKDAEFSYNSIKLTAYDYMQKFSGKLTAALTDGEPYDALLEICTACGVVLGSTRADIEAMVNGTVTLPMSVVETTETYRNVLGYIAAILCGNAVIGRDNKLYIKNYSTTPVRAITASDRYNASYIDYIGQYTTLALTNGDGDEETYTASGTFTNKVLTMSIGTNPLLNASSDKDTMAQDIIDELSTIAYAPCTISMVQDPSLDIGDSVTVSGGNIETPVTVILTRMDIKLYGQSSIVSAGGNYTLAERRTRVEMAAMEVPQIKQQTAQMGEQIKQITYDYLDPQTTSLSPIGDGDEAIVMAFAFKLEEATRVKFGSTINFETTRDGQDLVHLHVIYNVDNTPLNPNDPLMEYYDDGYHILTLDFLTDELAAGSHTFGVAFGVTGGTLS